MYSNDLSLPTRVITLRPIDAGERIQSLDIIRGVALFAVLIAYTVWNLGAAPFAQYTTFDKILNFALAFLVDSKAYTLLSFLFGLGFAIQMSRAEERGGTVIPVYLRRLFALVLIGLAHALLLRNGDILVPYASMGLLLLLFRNASGKVLAVAAFVALFLPQIARALWELSAVPFPERPETEGMGHLMSNLLWVRYWYITAITNWPQSLSMFFAGLYVGRKRYLENVAEHRRGLKWLLGVGLVVGVGVFVGRLIVIAAANPSQDPTSVVNALFIASWYIHAWGMAAFYAPVLLLLLLRPRWQSLLSPLAAVGRMALTNYLLQAAIAVPICIYFNLYDTFTPTSGLLLALGIWVLQVPFSILWLRAFQFGPAEWLWRSLTYGRLQPMQKMKVHAQEAVA
jgi:uncharacterized protein